MARALVLLAHGSRDPAWSRPLATLADTLAARDVELDVRIAYVEIQTPALAQVIDELATYTTDIHVLPVFWAAGGHVARDLPRLLDDAQARHPTLRLRALPPLADLPGLLDFVATQALALTRRNDQPATRLTAIDTSIP